MIYEITYIQNTTINFIIVTFLNAPRVTVYPLAIKININKNIIFAAASRKRPKK
jgi:hypothetical protein